MRRSLNAVLIGTFTLRFSTGLTGALLVYYLADLQAFGAGREVTPLEVGALTAAFYLAELLLSPIFGMLSDRLGSRPDIHRGSQRSRISALDRARPFASGRGEGGRDRPAAA